MCRVLATICGLSLSVSTIMGTNNPEDAAMREIRPEAIQAHVTFLADDLLEGRGTGTRGYDLAAKYIASQFQTLGLDPAGVNGTYFQPILFRSVAVDSEKTTPKLVRNGSEETLVWGQDYIARGDLRAPVSSISGEVVYVGYGVTAPDFGVDDYKGLDVRGKLVAYRWGAPARLPPVERSHYTYERNKLDNAAAHGAIGAIRIWDQELEKILPFSLYVQQATRPTMSWLGENGSPRNRRDEIRTVASLSDAATKKLLDGIAMPGALPSSITIRTTSRHSEVTSLNVAAVLRGSDPRLREEYVVYTAHADHLGISRPVNGDGIYNGALDNASGVAGLVETARAFSSINPRPRRSIIFLAVTGEENGLLGSDYFAEHPTVPRSQIIANINIEGLGLLYDSRDVVVLGSEHSSLGAIASRAAARMGLDITPDPMPEQVYFVRSDQYSFVRRGIPAVLQFFGTKAIDPSINARKVLADFIQNHYHMPSDDLNRPMDFKSGAKRAQFTFLLGYFVAQNDKRPGWNVGDFFGKTFDAK